MKVSVSSYSYSALGTDDFSRMRLAKEMGFDGIEFAEINPPEGVAKADHAKALKALPSLSRSFRLTSKSTPHLTNIPVSLNLLMPCPKLSAAR